MANPNLIQQAQAMKQETSHKVPGSLFVAMGIIMLSAAVYFVFFFVEMTFDSRASAAEDRIRQADLEIKQLNEETEEAQSFVERLENLKTLASSHIYWSGVLSDVAEHTDKRVQYVSLRGDLKDNFILLQARASDLAAVERNLVGLTSSTKAKKVSTSNVVYNIDPKTQIVNVTFDVRIDLQPGVLTEAPSSIELKSSNSQGAQ